MSIQPLPDNVVAQIKSSTTITSLNAVVCGLIKNSLDAKATKITVSIDYSRGNCSVEDNGLGILPREFKPDGGLCRLHRTSKFPPRNDVHGRHGTFLASVAALSLLSITSHHHGHHSHNSIRIHNSDILAYHTPALPEQRLLSFPHGTRTTIRDLFGSMPVRVKQRAVDAERGANTKEWERLRRALVALLLAWPGQVSLSLRDSVGGRSLVIRTPEESTDSREKIHDILGLTTRVSRVFTQAQLCDDTSRDLWVPLKASAGQVSIVGAVSLVPVASRQLQFISIGVRPASNDHGSNILYEELNRLFANSSFGVQEDCRELDEEEQNRRAKDRRYKTDGYTNQELRGKKSIDRWPMFYIKINLGEQISQLASCDIEDIIEDHHDSLAAIIDILRTVVYEFLKAHHFRPKYFRPSRADLSHRTNHSETPSKPVSRISTPKPDPKKSRNRVSRSHQSTGDLASTRLHLPPGTSRSQFDSPFDSWARIKIGQPQHAHLYEKASSNQDASAGSDSPVQPVQETPHISIDDDDVSENPLVAADGSLLRIPFPDVETDAGQSDRELAQGIESPDLEQPDLLKDGEMLWINPATKESLTIDDRTGLVIRPSRGNPEASGDACRLPAKKKLRTHTKPVPRDERSKWLDGILSSWENPVFQSPEPPIPVAFDEETALNLATKALEGHCHGCISNPLDVLQASHSVEGQLSRDNLRNAEVIAQVDKKFIFAKAPLSSPLSNSSASGNVDTSLIIIVDQHAADERCRVEALMKDYFLLVEDSSAGQLQHYARAQVEALEKPITFDVSTQDCRQFERFAEHFKYWGIDYQLKPGPRPKPQSKGAAQLRVVRLPPSIVERCRQEPRLLIDLLRKEVWKLDEQGHNASRSRHFPAEASRTDNDATVNLHWLARFHGCPQGILEIINSRACRSSIMFNDQLAHEECVDLLERLADCVLPFQCAHGRPSMVPLVDVGDLPLSRTDPGKPKGSFREEYKRWKASMAD
ncbi:hypothetical protein GGR52DRAFT_525919 [Hypoxylon sp. FL1284]|nr:hypothetical protein GGR52DRAFT_525919 [Hypoxylon sp. FL1284]